jgi:hypothetical protein
VVATSTSIALSKVTNNSYATQALAMIPMAAGDKYGIGVVGTEVSAYVKRTGDPTWLQVGKFTDSTYASGVLSIGSIFGQDRIAEVGGGAYRTHAVDDTTTITDAQTEVVGKAQADVAETTDMAVSTSTYDLDLADDLAIVDAPSAAEQNAYAQPDTVALADQVSSVVTRPESDSVALSDEVAPSIGAQDREAEVDDSLAASDAATKTPSTAATDTASVTDALAQQVAPQQTDSVAAADSSIRATTGLQTEVASLGDALAPTVGHAHVEPDAVALDDETVTEVAFVRSIDDGLAAGDSTSASTAGNLQIDDSIAATDEVQIPRALSVDEALEATDAVAPTAGNGIDDSVTGTDAATPAVGLRRSESAAIADQAQSAVGKPTSDTAALSDALSASPGRGASLADGAQSSDQIEITVATQLGDSLSAGDLYTSDYDEEASVSCEIATTVSAIDVLLSSSAQALPMEPLPEVSIALSTTARTEVQVLPHAPTLRLSSDRNV